MKKNLSILFILFIINLSATIINIPADQPTIQAGIDAAVDADTVLVQPGTYIENINYNGKNITVGSLFITTQNSSYIDQTIIDGSQNNSVVIFQNDEDSTAVLCGFTITNGNANEGGGGILCFTASPTINNLIIVGNSAFDDGGGIHFYHSDAVISDVIIDSNDAIQGGGIHFWNSSSTVNNLQVMNNDASGQGGGIFISHNSNLEFINVTINSNESSDEGGGFFCDESCILNINNTLIENNESAWSSGGGIYCQDSYLNISNSNIINNHSELSGGGISLIFTNAILLNLVIENNYSLDENGGGISCDEVSNMVLQNSIVKNNEAIFGGGLSLSTPEVLLYNVLISENQALEKGGAIYCWSFNPIFRNVTISNNTANGNAGGIFCHHSNPILTDCILWNNSPQEVYYYMYNSPSSITVSYSNIQGGETGIVTNNNGTVNWLDGNIDQDPAFDSASELPYSLTLYSPCINAGIPDTTGLNLPDLDLAGNPRIFDDRIDMGAYEFQSEAFDAEFEADITQGTAPLEVCFTDLSNGDPIYWGWDFDNDGILDSDLENPSFNYEVPGTYSVSLSVSNGTYSDTEVKVDYITVSETGVNEMISSDYALSNYPNPFNPSTTISFSVSQSPSIVEIAIFNLKGQKIRTFVPSSCHPESVEGRGTPNNYSVVWNGNDESGNSVGSGIYYYKLFVNGKTEAVRKCMLLK